MHSRSQYDGLAYRYIHWIAKKIGHNEHIDVVAGQRLAKYCLAYLILVLKGAHFVNEGDLVTVGEWVAVGKEYLVIVMLEDDLEGERVVN